MYKYKHNPPCTFMQISVLVFTTDYIFTPVSVIGIAFLTDTVESFCTTIYEPLVLGTVYTYTLIVARVSTCFAISGPPILAVPGGIAPLRASRYDPFIIAPGRRRIIPRVSRSGAVI